MDANVNGTIVNRVAKHDANPAERIRNLARRDNDLEQYRIAGFELTTTEVLDAPAHETYIDTLTRVAR